LHIGDTMDDEITKMAKVEHLNTLQVLSLKMTQEVKDFVNT